LADHCLAVITLPLQTKSIEVHVPAMSTADKLLTALSLFTHERGEWTIEAAAEALNVSASTAYRYIRSLSKAGLLDAVSSGRYVLGPAIIALDRQLRLQDPILAVAQPVMERLLKRNDGKGVVLLCRRFRKQVMCIHQLYTREPIPVVSYERGLPMGLYRGASSLVILANLPTRTLRSLWSSDASIISQAGLGGNWDDFRLQLKELRTSGLSVTHGQLDEGSVGIAAPIFQPDGQIIGSVSVVIGEDDAKPSHIAGASALVQAAAREVDAGLARLNQ
jgi:DNA-binding IclR family transcriptional regulator